MKNHRLVIFVFAFFPWVVLSACDSGTKNVDSCGDGFLDPGEECDKNEMTVTACQDLGFYEQLDVLTCKDDCTIDLAACYGRCGDSVIQLTFGEQCDQENALLTTNFCRAKGYYGGLNGCTTACMLDEQACTTNGSCGDGVWQEDYESCDGTSLGQATCEALGYPGGTLACADNCRFEVSACTGGEKCGDGVLDAPEQCDGGNLNGATCAGLEGFAGGVLQCGSDCRFDTNLCHPETECGDGLVYGAEQCDGANLLGQTCMSVGLVSGVLTCKADCTFDTTSCIGQSVCGDGQIQGSEACDGTNLNGMTCQILGYPDGTLTCTSGCSLDLTSCQALVEICDNDLDDDNDGDIDCDDGDCVAEAACIVTDRFLTIIGTSDLHSHLMGVGPARDYTPQDNTDADGTKSGLARHATIIKNIKAEKAAAGVPTILVDSGDSLTGDMVDLLSGTSPPVFHFFQLMQYDTVMLGDHEWVRNPGGTAVIINAAVNELAFDRPLLCSNLVTDAMSPADDDIETLVDDGVIHRYVLKTIDDDFTVGIFGMMGIEADSYVPQAHPVTFWHEDPQAVDGYAPVQALVDEIRTAGAHMVIHAGHAGIYANGIGEDRDTASNVSGIDVIMSGHGHQLLQTATKYLKVGNTYIIANGKYGENMTQLDVRYDLDAGAVTDATGVIHHVDDLILGDIEVGGMMNTYITMLDNNVLIPTWGITYSTSPIGHTNFDLPSIDFSLDPRPTGLQVEQAVSLLVADAQYHGMNYIIDSAVAANLHLTDPNFDASPIAAALIENSAVRDPILAGKTGLIAAADAFRAFPLGKGNDSVPGYPMMSFYVTPQEMKMIFEMNVEVMQGNVPLEYYLNPAGMRYIFDPTRGQFDKVVAVFLCNDVFTTMECFTNGTLLDLTDTSIENMLRLAVDDTVARWLPLYRYVSGDMVIDPKIKDGTIIDMSNDAEVTSLLFDAQPGDYDANGAIVQELKAWVALFSFIGALDDDWSAQGLNGGEVADGIPSVPARIYDINQVPTVGDPNWQLGLFRGLDKPAYCAMTSDSRICN